MGLVTNGTRFSQTEITNGKFPNFLVNGKRPRYLSEHPLLYFLAFDWLTTLNDREIWDETSKGQSTSQGNNENFVLLWSLHAERKILGLCRVNENFATVENLSQRERTDDTAILN